MVVPASKATKDIPERNKVCGYSKTGPIKKSDDDVVSLPHSEKKSGKENLEQIVETMSSQAGTTEKYVQQIHNDGTFENKNPCVAMDKDLGESSSNLIEVYKSLGDSEEDPTKKTVLENRCNTKSTLNESRDLYHTDFHDGNSAGDNTCEGEVNDYSNLRSVESLDMECHESGDDTVIVVKEKPRSEKRKVEDKCDINVLAPKLHRTKAHGEIHFVAVGEALKIFLETHPLIQGMYLNRGKRDTKRKLVSVARQKTAIDTGSWKRGSRVHERNRLDDAFELTEEGKRRKEMVNNKCRRDEYVINWYLWCPGHSNCQRKCGGIGICSEGESFNIYRATVILLVKFISI